MVSVLLQFCCKFLGGQHLLAAMLLRLSCLGKNNEIVTDSSLRQELALVMRKIYLLFRSLVGSDEMEIVKAVKEGSF